MNAIKEKILSGKPAIGTWMQLPCADIAEMIRHVGYDFCILDLEHTEISHNSVADIFRGLNGGTCQSGVRVAKNGLLDIRKPLDLGATVIIVPMISNKEDAEKAVAAAKYSPQGVRGYAFCRCNNWGIDFDTYVKTINEEIVVVAMIESLCAVENIHEILSVDGIDGVLVGPYDLSGSMGIPGELENPKVEKCILQVVEACQAHKKFAGQHIVAPTKEKIEKALAQGYRFLPLGIDAIYLHQALQEIKGYVK